MHANQCTHTKPSKSMLFANSSSAEHHPLVCVKVLFDK
jgi:hypothetical protein